MIPAALPAKNGHPARWTIGFGIVVIALFRLMSWAADYSKEQKDRANWAAAQAETANEPDIQCKGVGYQDYDLLPSQRRALAAIGSLETLWDRKTGEVTVCAVYQQPVAAPVGPNLDTLVHVNP